MTLAPIFRSEESLDLIQKSGYLAHLAPALRCQAEAIVSLNGYLPGILAQDFRHRDVPAPNPEERAFFEEHFFLALFNSLFQSLGVPKDHLRFYTEANQCIKGLITSADNLFDEENKVILPLKLGSGKKFQSIMQLMTFERLLARAAREARAWLTEDAFARINKGLLDLLAEIGSLEGSEEEGVEGVPTVTEMIDSVHRVRGGALFGLAFVAPNQVEKAAAPERWSSAERGIRRLGTAFQIVDDLTDFEFDMTRGSHNLLVAEAYHNGTPDEKAYLKTVRAERRVTEPRAVEFRFRRSALEVLRAAEDEARQGMVDLKSVGFWLNPDDAPLFVRAIVGLDGVSRIRTLTESREKLTT